MIFHQTLFPIHKIKLRLHRDVGLIHSSRAQAAVPKQCAPAGARLAAARQRLLPDDGARPVCADRRLLVTAGRPKSERPPYAARSPLARCGPCRSMSIRSRTDASSSSRLIAAITSSPRAGGIRPPA